MQTVRPVKLNPSSSADQTHICANSVDPDETARHEPSHQDLHCLPFSCFFCFRLKSPFASVDMSKLKDGIVHFRYSGVKRLIILYNYGNESYDMKGRS